jgi:hypothetical protein
MGSHATRCLRAIPIWITFDGMPFFLLGEAEEGSGSITGAFSNHERLAWQLTGESLL